jgi:allantoin racemase
MADFAAALSREHGMPVIDGVVCAVALAESAVRLGLRTTRLGGYAPPIRVRPVPDAGCLSN